MGSLTTGAAVLLALVGSWWFCGHPRWLGVEAAPSRRLAWTGIGLAGVLTGWVWARGEPLAAVMVWVLVLAAVADWSERVIPNRWVVATVAIGVGRMLVGATRLEPALMLAGGLGAFFLVLHLLMRGGLGLGDVKLAAALGLALGWPQGLDAFVWGVLAAGIYAAVLLVTRRVRINDSLAFGPFLALGALLAVLLT